MIKDFIRRLLLNWLRCSHYNKMRYSYGIENIGPRLNYERHWEHIDLLSRNLRPNDRTLKILS